MYPGPEQTSMLQGGILQSGPSNTQEMPKPHIRGARRCTAWSPQLQAHEHGLKAAHHSGGLHDEVVDRELGARGRKGLVELHAQFDQSAGVEVDCEVVVRNGRLGLQQSLRSDAPDLAVRHVGVVTLGLRMHAIHMSAYTGRLSLALNSVHLAVPSFNSLV